MLFKDLFPGLIWFCLNGFLHWLSNRFNLYHDRFQGLHFGGGRDVLHRKLTIKHLINQNPGKVFLRDLRHHLDKKDDPFDQKALVVLCQ